MAEIPAPQRARTANVQSPHDFTLRDWWTIAKRTFNAASEDSLFMISASVAFYGMLAIFPMLAALVAIYGYMSDPAQIEAHLNEIAETAPPGAYEIIKGQLDSITSAGQSTLGYASLIGTLLTLWTARLGVGALIDGLNLIYREREGRSLLGSIAVAYGLTLVIILVFVVALLAVVIIPGILAAINPGATNWIAHIVRWPIALGAALVGIGLLYRYGPARERARFSWISTGAVLALALWLLASSLFSWYVGNFANYNETYGSLGAVVGLMMWFYLSAFIVLLGGEVNAQMELHTTCDTTTGEPKPMGERGAFVADNTPDHRPPSPAAPAPDVAREPDNAPETSGSDAAQRPASS